LHQQSPKVLRKTCGGPSQTCKTRRLLLMCPLFGEFRDLGDLAKITGREY